MNAILTGIFIGLSLILTLGPAGAAIGEMPGDAVSVGGEKEGMRILFSDVEVADPLAPELWVLVENTNPQAAIFMDEGTALRLGFELFDGSGQRVDPNDKWWRTLDPKPEGLRRVPSKIPPGGRIWYKLDFTEGYGADWSKGRKLLVTWNPGYREGAAPNIYGWGLKAEYDMTPLVRKAFPQAIPDETTGKGAQSQDPQSSPAPVSSQPPDIPTTPAATVSPTDEDSPSQPGNARIWIVLVASGVMFFLLVVLYLARRKLAGKAR